MTEEDQTTQQSSVPPIFIVSGGMGSIGEEVVRSALAQFQELDAPLTIIPHVRHGEQIEEVIDRVASEGGVIVHTLMDMNMRQLLVLAANRRNIPAIDLVGPLLAWLSELLNRAPLGRPGLYRHLRASYFKRIAAIEYTVAHDDGRNPQGWDEAEIVLAGVSRTGKTPLSMYLSVQGWKVANVPLVKGIDPPQELFEIDRRRVFGLVIDPEQLINHRLKRQSRLGISLGAAYTDLEEVDNEVEATRRIFRRSGFSIVNVTDKPIEETADEIIARITRLGLSRV